MICKSPGFGDEYDYKNPPYKGGKYKACRIGSAEFDGEWEGVLIDGKAYVTCDKAEITEFGECVSRAVDTDDGIYFYCIGCGLDDSLYLCSAGLMHIIVDGKCGFIDRDEIVVPPQWDFMDMEYAAIVSNGCKIAGSPVNGLVVGEWIGGHGWEDYPVGGQWWVGTGADDASCVENLKSVSFQEIMEMKKNKQYAFSLSDDRKGQRTPAVGPFFTVKGCLFYAAVSLENAEKYGDFLINPLSHDEIWEKSLAGIFHVDYDYYPRGRVVYNKAEDKYVIYTDRCADERPNEDALPYLNWTDAIKAVYGLTQVSCVTAYDEHYQCHHCNGNYVR